MKKSFLRSYLCIALLVLMVSTTAFASYDANMDSVSFYQGAFSWILFLLVVILYVSKIKKMREQASGEKITDADTGIGNLLYFENYFENKMYDFSNGKYYVAYIIIDSNCLDVYHPDVTFLDVVKYTAGVLRRNEGEGENASRITENGFAFVIKREGEEEALEVIKNIIAKLNRYVDEKNVKPVFYASLYNLNESDQNCELLLFNLRRNCYKNFETENQLIICDEHSMNSAWEEKQVLESILRGFENNEFKMHLQFTVDNKSKKIVSAEALSRWENPEKGMLLPGKYIETLLNTGLISKHDFYMFDCVCRQLEKWHGTEYEDINISCNFTRITLSEDDFIENIIRISDKYNFDKTKVIIEMTEDAIEKNREKAMKNVRACKNLGFSIALDDMGNGYTSLVNLCDYPIDIVKIDRDILLKTNNERGKSLFHGIIALAHSLGLKVVCEGVETNEHNNFVSETNCDFIQGWYYSKVLPEIEYKTFLETAGRILENS